MNAIPLQEELDLAEIWRRRLPAVFSRPALLHAGGPVTFGQLDLWSDDIAVAARDAGVAPGDVLAIVGERSAGAIAAMLGAAKCGAMYVPVEPHLPAARRASILADAQPAAIVILEGTARAICESVLESATAPVIKQTLPAHSARARFKASRYPRDIPFYLLYTSGSSGVPKGVIGTQRGLLNRLEWMWREFPFEAGERTAHRTNLGFVDSVAEIWGSLLSGVPLVIVEPAAVADIDALISIIARNEVSRIVMVPSLLRAVLSAGRPLAQEWPALRYCVTSGETLPPAVAAELTYILPQCGLINLYGMTEAAADVTAFTVDTSLPKTAIPIGTPIDGMRISLMDDTLRPVARGERGHIYIGGVGLACGYHRRPSLTALSFIPDPSGEHPGARLYSTGDHGRVNTNGELEYLGRQDSQVKVRGHRIELAEIERHAREHPAITDCAAVVTEDGGDNLQLFASLRPQTELTAAELKSFLAERLPRYMVPAFVHVRNRLPLLPNGKIDRRSLAMLSIVRADTGEPPASEAERRVALIWQELLRIDMPGRRGQFLELGGNSLKAALAVTRLRAAFEVDLTVPEFLDFRDLAHAAQVLERRAAIKRMLKRTVADASSEAIDF
jgi:amino acid adenylation domain-containing protein